MSVQSFCGEDEGFCGEDEGFCGKDEEKVKNPLSLPHCLQCLHYILMGEAPTLSMCRHTNACADAALGMCRHNNEGKSID